MLPSSLFHKLTPFRPRVAIRDGAEVPLSFGDAPGAVESEYWALRREAGIIDLSQRGRILLRGEDAARFLHGMVTNDVQGLRPGAGQYAFLLNVHGHILADANIFRLDERSFLVDCPGPSHDAIWQALERHIIMDDVELEDQREAFSLFAVEGKMARRALEDLLPGGQAAIASLATRYDHVFVGGIEVRIIRATLSGEDGYWVLADLQHGSELLDSILAHGVAAHRGWTIKPVGFEALEVRRIEAGIPRYGIDITDKNLPEETGQMQALSFNKGCYIGQEVVERIRSRGHVNRKLMRLVIDGQHEIAPSTEILYSGERIGATGSSAYCFSVQKTIAFCYLRREFAEPGRIVTAAGFPAVVEGLPVISQEEPQLNSAQSDSHP